MTNKVSQVTIPLNPATLFTTVVGAVIIAFLFYLSGVPKEISTTQSDIRELKQSNDDLKNKLDKQWPIITEYGQRIQRIEDTRFTDEDATKLVARIVSEVKVSMEPIARQTERNRVDLDELEDDIKDIQIKQRE